MPDSNNPLKELEAIPTSTLLELSNDNIIKAFKYCADKLPFYKEILLKHSVNSDSVTDLESFHKQVPIIKKEDIFPIFKALDLCEKKSISDMSSAIVSSGTSGVFSYGILTKEDILKQQVMVDSLIDYYFPTKDRKVLIINALSMGVSFVSTYPVIPTSVRSDIVLHIIKKFSPYFNKIIVVTDPNFSKKIIEEGRDENLDWSNIPISFILGGTLSSNSLFQYLKQILNSGEGIHKNKNTVFGTMGLTELGLNIFFAPEELFEVRNILQKNPDLISLLLGKEHFACPEIKYYLCTSYHVEIADPDQNGFGRIVISNLDTSIKTPLIRYDTGDCGKIIEREKLIKILKKSGYEVSFKINLPIIAIEGRNNEDKTRNSLPLIIKEAVFYDGEIANSITGHFHIKIENNQTVCTIQMKKNAKTSEGFENKIQKYIENISGKTILIKLVLYKDFDFDVELSYENKWKHC